MSNLSFLGSAGMSPSESCSGPGSPGVSVVVGISGNGGKSGTSGSSGSGNCHGGNGVFGSSLSLSEGLSEVVGRVFDWSFLGKVGKWDSRPGLVFPFS